MPTNDDEDGLFAATSSDSKREDGVPDEYGAKTVREELRIPADHRC